ncbi:uncharacterized protein LY89DRAFT_660834 [Mollisia scopiformis]|uniref:BZIP domain-containing protein n=1 Tax=Mollisia scopiformis TaxID=149040 RepID=A0A132B3Y1_MOLSC|nr:uncharacterized protein LY89DRAFT_660834 [Mollisia scopiformis]KUJ07102.1 hypothetical protein LY89DRAFT_660834 [Mollisia scopiformis]
MSQSIIRFDNPKLSHVWKADDDWTGLKEKEERKKRQNRLNQRAYRVRNAPKDQPSNKRRAFRVERFRITDPPLPNYFGSNLATSIFNVAYTASQALSSLDHTLMNETYFPLSSDHLLHLIHFNVFRALISNKLLLNDTTVLLRAGEEIVLPIHQNLCEGLTLVRTKNEKPIPRTLYPTTKQMSIAHSSWLNMFPYPQVRDNLIQHQKNFNHRDLCNDLFGELFFKNVQNSPYPNTTSAPNETASEVWETWEDDVTARRKGLIVWGEPWDVNAWEITPGFLKKWSWIIEGCEEIITASNRWRAQRDEPPLTYVTSSGPDPNAREPTYELPKNLYS